MYIEFTIPSGAGRATIPIKLHIEQALKEWSEKYDIALKVKFQNYRLKVTFAEYKHYSFWALTWEPTSVATRNWRLVEPMNIPKSVD